MAQLSGWEAAIRDIGKLVRYEEYAVWPVGVRRKLMNCVKLRNGVEMPKIMMGTSICDLKGDKMALNKRLEDAIIYGESLKTVG